MPIFAPDGSRLELLLGDIRDAFAKEAVRPMSRGAACPDEPPTEANQHQTRCTASGFTPIPSIGLPPRA
jgi:hypothetical protein